MTLQLPFKPFTREEVADITEAPTALIDALWGRVLEEQVGDVGFMPGLNYMQCFAVFVSFKWLREGSGPDKATGVALFVANLGHEEMLKCFEQGLTFPAPTRVGGILVTAPKGTIGQRLNLEVLHREFRSRLDEVFRKKVQVSGG